MDEEVGKPRIIVRELNKTESPPTPEVWDYETFREYLLALTRGKDFLLPREDYPTRIQLSDDWHGLLNGMRQESRDGKERFALVGFKDDHRAIYLPRTTALGESTFVPGEVILKTIEQAKRQAGITELVGDIHSHPNGWWKKIHDMQNIILKPFGGDLHAFSPGDLYCMVLPDLYLPMIGLAESDRNLFAFRTKQSEMVPGNELGFDQDKFDQHWAKQFGLKIVTVGKAKVALTLNPRSNPWEVDKAIAQRHGLVLYKGAPGLDMVKVFPNK